MALPSNSSLQTSCKSAWARPAKPASNTQAKAKLNAGRVEVTFPVGGVLRGEKAHFLAFDPLSRAVDEHFVAADGKRSLAFVRRQVVINTGVGGIGLTPAKIGFHHRIRRQHPMWF